MPTSSPRTRPSARFSFAARAAVGFGVCAAVLVGSAAAASASTAPGESTESNTMVIRVEIPARTAAPSPVPTDDPAAGGDNGGGLAGTGYDASLLFLLAGAGVVAIGAGATIAARRRVQAAARDAAPRS